MSANLENLGYAQAQSSDSLDDRANEAIATISGFPETVPDEARAALYRGYIRRYNERRPPVTYAVVDGNYVQATPEMISNKKVEKVEIGVSYAMSFSTHEYGKLTQENPALRKIVESIREDAGTYCSNRLGDLKRAAKKILRVAQGGTKRESRTFKESVEKMFQDLDKSVKVKSVRGRDSTASPEKFKLAVAAFWKTYNA